MPLILFTKGKSIAPEKFSPPQTPLSVNNSSTVSTGLQNCSVPQEAEREHRNMRDWKNLGMVDTIYEEEYELSSPSLSPTIPSLLLTPFQTRVDAWSLATRRKPDVLIRVQGTVFHLHKDRLISRSSYLKRHLTEVSDFTLSPPLNIAAETFTVVADFCYSSNVVLTPSNVSALRVAAELLCMEEEKDADGENLKQVTETFFRSVIGSNRNNASIVLRSCMPLLPEAETTAFLFSRCLEAVNSAESVDNDSNDDEGATTCLKDVLSLHLEDLEVVVDSMNRRFDNHDMLYRIIDIYLKGDNNVKMTEEQRSHLSSFIDCSKLSHETLVEAIQNPTMPLRFLVRAMLVEQLNTRHTVISVASNAQVRSSRTRRRCPPQSVSTLGAIMERDAALRQAAKLSDAMEATSCRIQSLEKELHGMKKLLLHQHQIISEGQRSLWDSARSRSFHNVSENPKIARGERGSTSSASFRFGMRDENRVNVSSSSEGSFVSTPTPTPKPSKNFRQRLISGLKNAFWNSNPASKRGIERKASSKEDDPVPNNIASSFS